MYGINDDELKVEYMIVLNGLCIINCIVLVIKVLDDVFLIEFGVIMMIYVLMYD